jgi:hypothetical protein
LNAKDAKDAKENLAQLLGISKPMLGSASRFYLASFAPLAVNLL